MKLILTICILFTTSSALAGEFRIFGMQRFGEPMMWNEFSEKFPKVIPALQQTGKLTIAKLNLIESVGPYNKNLGKSVSRPALLDDLYYESLLLEDPVEGTERMYPLIAKSLRVATDWSYVIFELNTEARFQDDSPVTAADIQFSYDIFVSTKLAPDIANQVKSILISGNEIRFDFYVNGQAARDVIMTLARIKIIKPNPNDIKSLGGIPLDFMSTGPYRITQLGRARLALIKNPFYWAKSLNTRKGFFNFRRVEILAFDETQMARESLNSKQSNFYLEPQLTIVRQLADELLKLKVPVQLIQETQINAGLPLNTLQFDVHRPMVSDYRVRQALLLAYDFDQINHLLYGGQLDRPASFLDDGRIIPFGLPSPLVRRKMEYCELPKEASLTFESYGNNLYAQLGDRRLRQLTAMRYLQEAGYRLVDGKQVKDLPDGKLEPLVVRVVTSTLEQNRGMFSYRADLASLGVTLEIVYLPNPQSALRESRSGKYDIILREELVLTRDRWPRLDLTDALFKPLGMPCVDRMLAEMKFESPLSDGYRATSEALARIQQSLALNIYTGQPRTKNFFLDQRIQVPAGLSVERAHLYGYWREGTLP